MMCHGKHAISRLTTLSTRAPQRTKTRTTREVGEGPSRGGGSSVCRNLSKAKWLTPTTAVASTQREERSIAGRPGEAPTISHARRPTLMDTAETLVLVLVLVSHREFHGSEISTSKFQEISLEISQ